MTSYAYHIVTFALITFFYSLNCNAERLPLQHGVKYHNRISINDYFVSEKYDGIRGYWDGNSLFTRQGNPIFLPQGFTKNWPKVALDGELWSARGQFQKIVSCVRKKRPEPECWTKIKFMVFDLPTSNKKFSQRVEQIKKLLHHSNSQTISPVKQFTLTTHNQLFKTLDEVVAQGAEGLMLHYKHAYYKQGRNSALLKLKPYQDEEAFVLKHIPGKGKFKGMLGAILVKNKQGIQFKIGTGFSHKERLSPPAIGSEITYKYIGKTERGVPRFASFLRIKQ
ncbi:MAG: DNA ligase [Thalassotalea sp.]